MEATDRSDAPAPSAPDVQDAEARDEQAKSEAVAADPKTYLVCVPGSAFGTSVFQAESEQDAANQFAAATGVTAIEDENGDDTVRVAVAELNSVQVDHSAVKEILNPKE